MNGKLLLEKNMDFVKYGSCGWISNANKLKLDEDYNLYALNSGTISGGRDYVALPVKLKITSAIKQQYNIR